MLLVVVSERDSVEGPDGPFGPHQSGVLSFVHLCSALLPIFSKEINAFISIKVSARKIIMAQFLNKRKKSKDEYLDSGVKKIITTQDWKENAKAEHRGLKGRK